MKKSKKIIILLVGVFILSISTVYAITLIKASDVIYDNSKSGGSSNNVQGAIDELYSMKESVEPEKLINENMISYITKLSKRDTTTLITDETTDKNIRYIGSNPNNYVEFNGELWRVIGIMNNVKDSSGTSASRVKIIREESIGKYSYDNKPKGTGSSTIQYGSNEWNDSAIMKVLNEGAYWNKSSGSCPYETLANVNNNTTPCDFTNNGLTIQSKEMISNVIWNIGGTALTANTDSTWIHPNVNTFYTSERGNGVYSGRKATWTGYVGLMYASDYGYATGGNSRQTCLNKYMYNSSGNDWQTGDCGKNDWLYSSKYDQRTMSPSSRTNYDTYVVQTDESVIYNTVFYAFAIRPVVYLDTKLLITKGEGSKSNPYKLSFEKEITANDTSNASHPKLDEEGTLIPVTLADDGTVTKIGEEDASWYNYDEQRWANAVILIDSPSKTYKEGDIIAEADIESYFVWIPKYKYKLWNTETASKKAHEIDIIFDTKDTTDVEGESCKTPMTSGATGNCNNGEYMTHPAFISLGVNGFWVGKFETGYKGATSTASAQVNSSDSSKIIVKPNAYSWRSNTVYNFFVSAYNYERSLDSHMMKNTEWGAVAYLSHSKYGINNEVNINNNSSYKTGYSGLLNLNQSTYPGTFGDGDKYNQAYNTTVGYLASTTGNISGVYDMSGGAHEYMSSYVDGQLGSSGFTTSSLSGYNAKYYDVYSSKSDVTTYQYRILGDATGELSPFNNYKDSNGNNTYCNSWYIDFSNFVSSTYSWFNRGRF